MAPLLVVALLLLTSFSAAAEPLLIGTRASLGRVDFPPVAFLPGGGELVQGEARLRSAPAPEGSILVLDLANGNLRAYPDLLLSDVLALRGLGNGRLALWDGLSFHRPHPNQLAAGVLDRPDAWLVATEVAYLAHPADLRRIDSDADGLSDYDEQNLDGDPTSFTPGVDTDPTLADSDGDGLSDFDELNGDGDPSTYTPGADSDPNDPDTDGDGTPDGSDPFPVTFVEEDFTIVDGGGVGFAPGSGWGGVLEYDTDYPADPEGTQHVRTPLSAQAFRDLASGTAALLESLDELWLAIDIRLDEPKQPSQFAGLSPFAGAQERFFMGATFPDTVWGTNGFLLSAVPAGAEWARLMVRLDFADGVTEIYVNGALEDVDSFLPPRGWTRLRLASGGNAGSFDRLRIGGRRDAVEVPEGPRFAAATNSAVLSLLDARREQVGTGISPGSPQAIANDGARLFFSSGTTMVAADLDGQNPQTLWGGLGNFAVGLTFVDGLLAVREANTDSVDFRDPATGALVYSFPHSCGSGPGTGEGLGYDGTLLWVNCPSLLEGLDPATGILQASLGNPTSACTFGGTAITASAPDELTVGCHNGDWYRLHAIDGTVLDSGNNGVTLSGITTLPEPGRVGALAAGAAALLGLGARRRRRQRAGASENPA